MARLGGHARTKYATGTLIGTSEGRGWEGLLAERWQNSAGDLGEVEIRDTEIIVMIRGICVSGGGATGSCSNVTRCRARSGSARTGFERT